MTSGRASDAPASTPPLRRPPARRLGWLLLGFAIVVVLVAALQPWWLAPIVAQRLAKSSGRAVHLDRMWLSLSASFAPVLQVRGVRIDNAPWADRARPFASLAAATVVFSWRSLGEGRPIVAQLVLRDGEVDLERRADGLRNWRLAHPDDRGPAHLKVLAIRGEHATVRFRHEPLALDVEVRATPNAVPAGAPGGADDVLPTRIDARGTWDGASFAIDAATEETITLLETGRAVRIRGKLEAGSARLDVDGVLGDIVRWPQIDAHVVLEAASLPRLLALFTAKAKASTPAPLRLDATLRGGAGGYALANARARLGRSDAAGEVRWVRGDERNALHAELTSDTLDVADLHPLLVRPGAPSGAASASGGVVHAAERGASAPRANSTDIDVQLAARRVRAPGIPEARDASFVASLGDQVLHVTRLAFALGHGRVAASGTVDLAHPLRADGELDVSALPIETLLGESAARHRLTGVLHGHAALRGSGDTVDALLADATGTVSAALAHGTISSLLDAEMGLQGGRIVKSLLRGAEPIALRCAAVVVEVRAGRGTLRTLVVDSERTHTTGAGTIDLAHRTLDVVLTPQAKQPGLFILDRSIRVHGPIAAPAHELVARARHASTSAEGCKPG